jgi:FlaA1/EpsC-like NDP-sugar epimerase
MKNKLVIVGAGAIAQVAYEYFSTDSDYEVVSFSVEEKFITENTLFGLPIVPFEKLSQRHSPQKTQAFVAISYSQLNRLRKRLAENCIAQGFTLASYISSNAKIAKSAQIGDHCLILEDNVVQPFVTIGKNFVAWSGNHMCHRMLLSPEIARLEVEAF